jgi:Flp pilus assembly pilin Flp
MSRRMSRSLPVIGAAIAVVMIASAMRRKGVISGALDSMLNAVPFVGAAKNAVEVVRGRDFFPDRFGPGVNGV